RHSARREPLIVGPPTTLAELLAPSLPPGPLWSGASVSARKAAAVPAAHIEPAQTYLPDIEPALRQLDEKTLRERVLPELLRRLAFVDVRHRHGPREEGKDLLAWRMSPIDTIDWVGFVVKAGDLNAQVASSAGIRTALHQVEQVLDHE